MFFTYCAKFDEPGAKKIWMDYFAYVDGANEVATEVSCDIRKVLLDEEIELIKVVVLKTSVRAFDVSIAVTAMVVAAVVFATIVVAAIVVDTTVVGLSKFVKYMLALPLVIY